MKNLKKWVQKQWAGVSFGDARLSSRVKSIAEACVRHPDKSIPGRCQDWASVKAAYRFLDSEKISHREIQKPHYENVITTAEKSKLPVLFIQDGSELLFNTHRFTFGLGPTADANGNGLLFHSCLAVRYHGPQYTPEVLGLAHQTPWIRPEVGAERSFLESKVWLNALEDIGSPPVDQEWITVGDRGSDVYDFVSGASDQGWKFIVRAKHNRHIRVAGESKRLMPWVRSLTDKASKTAYLRAQGEEFGGEVTLCVSWGEAQISPPVSSEGAWNKGFSFVRVHCKERPKLEWILITNLKVSGKEEAFRVVDIYRHRWIIEEYHKCLKSGCRIEMNQLKQGKRILNLLGILGVVATQLLALKEKCRINPQGDAVESVSKDMHRLICRQFRLKKLTIREFWRCVARLGGFLARKSDGEPGWQTIWQGYSRLNDMLLGYSILGVNK